MVVNMATFFWLGCPPKVKFFGQPQTLGQETWGIQRTPTWGLLLLLLLLLLKVFLSCLPYQPLPEITLSWFEFLDHPIHFTKLNQPQITYRRGLCFCTNYYISFNYLPLVMLTFAIHVETTFWHGCSLPHSSARYKNSSRLQFYLVHQCGGCYTSLLLNRDDASWAPSSWSLHMRNTHPTNPTTCRLRGTQQFWQFTCAMPIMQ